MSAGDVPREPWPAFRARLEDTWQQGEHVSMIGPTGSGKTTLALGVLDIRSYVVALGTKREDPTLSKLTAKPRRGGQGWRKIEAWPPPPRGTADTQRVVLWPKFTSPDDLPNQRYQIDRALRLIFTEGRWTVFADELWYLSKFLGAERLLELYWSQGRSAGLSLVGGTQRPAWVPRLMYSSATHLFFWRDTDETNLKAMAALGGLNAKAVRAVVEALPRHDVLYVNTRDDTLVITRAERA